MPEITYKTKAEIPEEFQSEAKEVNGTFTVNVVLKSKVDEFRDRNVTVMQERDALKNKLDAFVAVAGDDPAKFKGELDGLRATDQQVKDGKLTSSKDIEAAVAARVQEAKAAYEAQLRTLANERDVAVRDRDTSNTKFKRSIIDREFTNAALAPDSGINPVALPDILARVHAVYQVGEGDKLVPKTGDTIIYGSDGVSPMSPKEWLKKLVQDAPHFAKPTSGGGATGGGKPEFGGLSQEAFLKLSPTERMDRARNA